MKYDEERKQIESRFQTIWAASDYKGIPIIFENVPFKVIPGKDYVAIQILAAGGEKLEMGNTFFRNEGIIQFDIYVREETGSATGKKIADVISDSFRNVRFGDAASGYILTRTPSFRSLGVDDGRFRMVLSVEYQRDVSIA